MRGGGGVVLFKEISFPTIANCCIDGQHTIVVGDLERERGGGGGRGGTGVGVVVEANNFRTLHCPLI